MATATMTRSKTPLPPMPYPGFPLTAHPTAHGCKKIKGKLYYFGCWEDGPQRSWTSSLNRRMVLALAGRRAATAMARPWAN